MLKPRFYQITGLTGFLCIALSIALNFAFTINIKQLTKSTENKFEEKFKQCSVLLENLAATEPTQFQPSFLNNFESEQIGLYAYKNDSLIFWNNARWPLIDSLENLNQDFGIVKQKQGIYFYVTKTVGNKKFIALNLLKSHFDIQNNYLKNDYGNWTGIPKSVNIHVSNSAENIVQLNKKNLFAFSSNENVFYNSNIDFLSSILFIGGFVFLIIAALLFISQTASLTSVYVVLALFVLFRIALIVFKIPEFLYRIALYDLRLFGNGQSLMNAFLGDVLLNAMSILFLSMAFNFIYQKQKTSHIHKPHFIIQLLGLSFIFFQFNLNLKSLVSNSTLNFDFINVFSSNWILLVILVVYAAYAIALFVFLWSFIQNINTHKQGFYILLLGSFCICCTYVLMYSNTYLIESFWFIYFSVLIYLTIKFSQQNLVLALGLMVLLIALTTAALLHHHLRKNQAIDLELFAQHLSEKKDAILESEYGILPTKITEDENFLNLLNVLPSSEREVIQKLKQEYFSGYFDRYNLDFSLFDSLCNPLLPVKNPLLVNEGYFEDQIKTRADTLVNDLYFLSSQDKPVQYIALIKLNEKNLYVLMEPKQFEETGSFPDLLIDQSLQKQNKLNNVSFAVYHANKLSNRVGDFNYPEFIQDSASLSKNNVQYEHFYFNTGDHTQVIISQLAKNFRYLFTFNSYILLFLSAFVYLCYLLYIIFFTPLFSSSSLTRRIQTIIILLLLFSMSAVGIISGNLVAKQFETKNQKQLSEKTQIIISELTTQFKLNELFDVERYDLLNLKLKEYARLFNTPISMFDGKGRLVNTSEIKLYDLGLASNLSNPSAYNQLKQLKAASVCVNEKAGKLDYMSMYTAVFDGNKNIIGLINLPYFAKQNDLNNELSGIISALINVYVILFVLSIFAGLILSGYITRPLRLIQQQIAKITLGKQNEKIVWNSKDEIGKLVFEYNQMLVKLESSANQLAQSERESAWREMAKQVAHEIKNPLTPMKLNLQYLQHLIKSNPDDFAERFEKASAGIIEQIDSLANIATEFSNFAKLPVTQLEEINLVEIVSSSTNLFDNQQVNIVNELAHHQQLMVKGDRDQCLRVFNNVIKNALHAVEEVQQAQIKIQFELKEKEIIVSITDNGCGIADDLKPKIFTPNFTTKSTGSGLGLAMVKNCMLGFGGDVYFESERNIGSTFYLRFVRA